MPWNTLGKRAGKRRGRLGPRGLLGLVLACMLAGCSVPAERPDADPAAGPAPDAGATAPSGAPAASAHQYLEHVATRWPAAPGEMGLLAVLEQEAGIAARYAAFARRKTGDLGWMQAQLRHVRHALAPESEPAGPGLGFGVARAARGVARHVGLALAAPDAGDLVRRFGPQVESAASRIEGWADEALLLSAEALAEEEDTAQVAAWVEAVVARLDRITESGIAEARSGLGWMLQDHPAPLRVGR